MQLAAKIGHFLLICRLEILLVTNKYNDNKNNQDTDNNNTDDEEEDFFRTYT